MPRKCPNPEQLFRTFNRKYFNNRLPNPPDTVVRFAKITGALKDCIGYQLGDEIVLNNRFRDCQNIWVFTLFHEMVHMSLPPSVHHGPRFQREMRRLARIGAFEKIW